MKVCEAGAAAYADNGCRDLEQVRLNSQLSSDPLRTPTLSPHCLIVLVGSAIMGKLTGFEICKRVLDYYTLRMPGLSNSGVGRLQPRLGWYGRSSFSAEYFQELRML